MTLNRSFRHLATIAFLFASVWGTAQLLPSLSLVGVDGPRVQQMPAFERPGKDSFFVFSVSDELSQMVLYHDLGRSISNARRADILFVGNSRMPLGLREEVIVPAAEALGLSAFSLACGHADKVRFALELIRKHDLRPKIVVVSGGPHIFIDGVSDNADRAMKMSRWQAWKERLETSAGWAFQARVHSSVAKLDFHHQELVSPWIIYRSSSTGWWQPAIEPDGRYPTRDAEEWSSYDRTLPLATELQKELAERGTLLVLTLVPYGDTRRGHLPFLSQKLSVPSIEPTLDDLSMADGSHLNRSSARRFSQEFWQEFVSLPEVRQRLSLLKQ